jgi:hypothetical protein
VDAIFNKNQAVPACKFERGVKICWNTEGVLEQ